MVLNETELKQDVRDMTGYTSVQALSDDGLDVAYRRAQLHIRVEKSLGPDYEWFDSSNPERGQALFWWTCLFAKVQTGELDSQDVQVGAIDMNALLAKDNNSVTQWFRSAQKSLEALEPDTIMQTASPIRSDREYVAGSFDKENSSGGGAGDGFDI